MPIFKRQSDTPGFPEHTPGSYDFDREGPLNRDGVIETRGERTGVIRRTYHNLPAAERLAKHLRNTGARVQVDVHFDFKETSPDTREIINGAISASPNEELL